MKALALKVLAGLAAWAAMYVAVSVGGKDVSPADGLTELDYLLIFTACAVAAVLFHALAHWIPAKVIKSERIRRWLLLIRQ